LPNLTGCGRANWDGKGKWPRRNAAFTWLQIIFSMNDTDWEMISMHLPEGFSMQHPPVICRLDLAYSYKKLPGTKNIDNCFTAVV
jgi:transposase